MILALAGGVGGAKLANGLARVVDTGGLVIAVNTGDDFRHLGLHISPDLDTVMYNLAGQNNSEIGWGLAGETWNFMTALGWLGGPDWFKLGDKDLATHIERTRRMVAGETLSEVTAALCARFGVAHKVVPMSDEIVTTLVRTKDRWLPFQEYFVALRCEPEVSEFRFSGVDLAKSSPGLRAALESNVLRGIVICPSNPFVSIDPILAIADVRSLITAWEVPVVAVSPIVGGRAIKGPTLKMMIELGIDPSAFGVARHYGSILDGFIIDHIDMSMSQDIETLGIQVIAADVVMKNVSDQERLAGVTLEFLDKIRERR